ncbi:MAG: pilus assembly protein PilQ [Alphaproteobacteria bacterium]|nr:pilus assembly protein PilQ [Alphaproteobacteria bacterium]
MGIRAALLAATASTLLSSLAWAGEPGGSSHSSMKVDFDQTSVVRLDRDAKTVLVGNSAIADAQMIDPKTVYVLGRMFGQTNIVALDANGEEVLNTRVTVGVSNTSVVTLYRGAQGQRTLACSPRCERTLTQGDAEFQPMLTDADRKTEVSDKNNKISSGGR